MSIEELRAQIAIFQSAPAVALLLVFTAAAAGFWFGQRLSNSTIAGKDGEISVLRQRLEAYKDNLGADKPEDIRKRLSKLEAQFGDDWQQLSTKQEEMLVARLKGVKQPERLTITYENDLALPIVKSLTETIRRAGLDVPYSFKGPVNNSNISVGFVPHGETIYKSLHEVLSPIPVGRTEPPVGANFDEGYVVIMIGARK